MSSVVRGLSAASARGVVWRVLHVTDVHFYVRPTWRELLMEPKRWIGLLNMEVLGRRLRFDGGVQRRLVREVERHRPSHLVLSGDLTSFATEAEFVTARTALHPLLGRQSSWRMQHTSSTGSAQPAEAGQGGVNGGEAAGGGGPVHRTVVLRGNHDVYTFESARLGRFDRFFGAWRPPTGRLVRWDAAPEGGAEGEAAKGGGVGTRTQTDADGADADADASLHVLAMDPCQPNRVSSHGHFDEPQLSAVSSALSSFAQRRSPSFLLLLCHYPLLSPTGEDYGRTHRWHGVDNGHRMLDVLRTGLKAAYTTPLHAAAFLHGHVHKGYRVDLPLHSVAPPSLHPADGAARAAASADASSLASADPSHPPTLSVPMLDPGSSGRSFSAQHHRAAAYNLYTITWTPTAALSHDGAQQQPQQPQQPQSQPQPHHSQPGPASGSWTLQVERFVHDGTAFQREPAPYTSGY